MDPRSTPRPHTSPFQRVRRRAALAVATLACCTPADAAARAPAGDRVEALVAQLSLEEKAAMVHVSLDPSCAADACVSKPWYVPAVPRLGLPGLRFVDGPAGLHLTRPATAMPAPIALAATFDPALAGRYGATVAAEARAVGQDVLLSPMVNLVRVPTGGRNFETFGEDPLLAARLAAAQVRGIQRQGVIADVKHFVANDFERARRKVDVRVDERSLMEAYLAPFEAAVRAGAGSVMCALNQVNGVHACSNPDLLRGILKGRWGFRGFVRSDWGGTQALSDLVAGLDIQVPPTGPFTDAALVEAATSGTAPAPAQRGVPERPAIAPEVWRASLDDAVRRILWAMDRAGLLDPRRRHVRLGALRERHATMARRVASAGATLLRNRRRALPLSEDDATVLVTGPAAVAPVAGGGGSSFVIPYPGSESAYAALAARAPRGVRLRYEPGWDLDGTVPPRAVLASGRGRRTGLLREQVAEAGSGRPRTVEPAIDRTGDHALPPGTTWRWTAVLRPPRTGRYDLKLQAAGQADASLEVTAPDGATTDLSLGDFPRWGVGALPQPLRTHVPPGLEQSTMRLALQRSARYRIEVQATAGTAPTQLRLTWAPPGWKRQRIRAAASAARRADKAVVFAHDTSTEGEDRESLSLPGLQDRLISAVARANPRTVVVLNTGGPVLMPWLEDVDAVLQMWYPGQEGGAATARVLLGRDDPGGRLPVTFPTGPTDQPAFSPDGSSYPGTNEAGFPVVQYAEGPFGGYRWYDRTGVQPLFPFGHGLSYATFRYSKPSVTEASGRYDVRFTVQNTGPVAGTAVPQVYVGPPPQPPVPMAVKALAAMDRVRLDPGASERVHVRIPRRALSYWSEAADEWVHAGGRRTILVGESSRDVRLRIQAPETPLTRPAPAG